MTEILDFILLFLRQFAGGPGPAENNLVRFGLPAILWAILWYIAWSRQRQQILPREKLLLWGFGLAFVREMYMVSLIAWEIIGSKNTNFTCNVIQPLEHAMAMIAMIVVAAAYLRYIMNDQIIPRRYLLIGIGITSLVFIYSAITWPVQLAASPQLKFHQTLSAWLFHVPLSILMGVAIFLLWKRRGWLRNVIASSLTLYLLSELLLLLNYSTDRAYSVIICPIGNGLHILAIPLLGYVYLKEQSLEKKHAEDSLISYRDHLEELVEERTTELKEVNSQLVKHVSERAQAENALDRLAQRYGLILKSAGEGICGIDHQGKMIFVNDAAARMLGYQVNELINLPSHLIWHQHKVDGKPDPLEEWPIYQGYKNGLQHYGDDEHFWRKDGSGFPASYFSNPIWEKDELVGTVIVFSDITERKRTEAEIEQHTSSLTTQNAVAAILSQSLEVEVNLKKVIEMVRIDEGMDLGLIYLLEPASDNLSLYIYNGNYNKDEIQSITADGNACHQISLQAFRRNQAVTANLLEISTEASVLCLNQTDLCNLISVPISSKGRMLGVMTFGTRKPDAAPMHKLEMLTAIGQQIGMAIENARLYKDAESWADELTRLHEASAFLSSSFKLDQITAEIARQSAWLLKCQKSFVTRLNRQTNLFELAAVFGINRDGQEHIKYSLTSLKFLPELASQPAMIPIQDAFTDQHFPESLKESLNIKSALIVPIWTSDKPTDYIILIDTQTKRIWNAREIELMEILANRAAVSLVYTILENQLELDATLQERQRIAADMHDGLSQTISLLGLHLDKIQDLVETTPKPEFENYIQEIREIVNHAYSEVRRAITNLQELPAPRKSLQTLIQDLLAKLKSSSGPELIYKSELVQDLFLIADQTDQVLLVVREATLNAIHHADAHTISVYLGTVEDRINISIEDDGSGFEVENHQSSCDHFGLTIMKARAERISGKLQIDTSLGKGSRIDLAWRPELIKTPNAISQPIGSS